TQLAGLTIDYRPLFLRGLDAFANGLPYGGNKLAYSGRDLMRCVEHHRVETVFPNVFPINGVYALRVALVTLDSPDKTAFAAYHQAMLRAAWRHNRDVSKKNVVLEVAGEAGLDAASLASAIEAPA